MTQISSSLQGQLQTYQALNGAIILDVIISVGYRVKSLQSTNYLFQQQLAA